MTHAVQWVEAIIKMVVVMVTFISIPVFLAFILYYLIGGRWFEVAVLTFCLFVFTYVNEKVSV